MKAQRQPLLSLQALVQDFFEKHLSVERNASPNTILAYRDALKLFLTHTAESRGCAVDELECDILGTDAVLDFLRWLEESRGCGARTRNQRLAALKAFARYVTLVAPEHLERCRRLRALPPARFERPEVSYLDHDETVALLGAIDGSGARRDRALFLLLYNTGARVQEIVDLDTTDLRLDPVPVVTLKGKGRKQRTCPLWARTVTALEVWLSERGPADGPLFLNAQGRRLTRSGVAYLLGKMTERAGLSPRHARRISPHVLRHTTAMHMLDAGVDITTLAAWMGHAHLSTTYAYVEITLRKKQQALAASVALPELADGDFPDGELLTWLSALGRSRRYAQREPPPTPRDWPPPRSLRITARSP